MQAPQSVQMQDVSRRGETPFDSKPDPAVSAEKVVADMLTKKEAMLEIPDMLEMEPYYVEDVVRCDPYEVVCNQDLDKVCIVNDEYDFAKVLNGKYFSEGCHMQAPTQEGMHEHQDASGARRDQSTVPVEELRPIGACMCCISSLYCSCPGCIGCSGKYKFLIFMSKFSCCKCLPNPGEDEDRRCVAIVEQQRYLVIPQSCCEFQCQTCCFDDRGAFPCTKSVPCIVNIYGLTLCADWKCKPACCALVGDLIPRLKPDA